MVREKVEKSCKKTELKSNLLRRMASEKMIMITKSFPPVITYLASVTISHLAPSKNGGHIHVEVLVANGVLLTQVPPLRHLLTPKQSVSYTHSARSGDTRI